MAGAFLSDIQTLRKRAREHIAQGAVTPGYHADRDVVLKLLNEALATEIVCVLRYKRHYFMAKGKEKIAKAELDAKMNPTAANQRKAKEAKAEAEYDVAKERCEDQKGNEKDVCEKDAKAKFERAKADIKRADAKPASTAGAGSTSKTTK